MRKILYAFAFLLCFSAATPMTAHAQSLNFYSFADLKTLFVTNKAGFVITNEGFPETRAGRSLKITAVDTTNGSFAGVITGTSTVYRNGSSTQSVTGKLHIGATHGGTIMWIEYGYSYTGTESDSQSFIAGVKLFGVNSPSVSGYIAGFQSEREASPLSGFASTNQPFSGILAVLP
ncbi:MAG TPA: hypothetical protein VKQ29_04870 [Aliidongia sp.]|nr:hypothetical protein [Aliidongia sp.]